MGENTLVILLAFKVSEIDISRRNYRDEYYVNNLDETTYRQLWTVIDGLEADR